MTEFSSESQPDLLDLIGRDPRNGNVEQGDFTLTIIRGILQSRGMVVPTLAEITPAVIQTPTLTENRELSGGKITEIVEAHQAPTKRSDERTLVSAIQNYKDHLDSPVALSEFLSAFWMNYRVPMGLTPSDVRLTDCPYKQENIWQFMKLENPQPGNPNAEIGFYLPQVLATKEGLILLGKGFPEMGSWALQEGNNITNGHHGFGWMRVDAGLNAPYRLNKRGELTGLNVDELKKKIADNGREGEIVNIYAPSGKVIKTIFDYYPDQGSTWSRLPESLETGEVVGADFDFGGGLLVHSGWNRVGRHPSMGGRSFLGAKT